MSAVDGSAAPAGIGERTGGGWARAALVLLAACTVGVFADRGALLPEPWRDLAEVGTPFVLVAFAAGRQCSRTVPSALWGAVVLSVGQAAYYAWLSLGQHVAWGTLTHGYHAGAWLVAGSLVGAVGGALGQASRAPRRALTRALGWGLVVAVPLAEGARLVRWDPPRIAAGTILVMAALAVGGWAIRRDRAPWQLGLVTAAAVTPAVLLAENFRHLV